MPLPWVRFDSSFATHDKVLRLLAEHGERGRSAAFVYCCGLGHCGLHGTDGLVSFAALPFVHGRKRDAELLVEVGMWRPDPAGWRVSNWTVRQEVAVVSAAKKQAASKAASKAACVRWHGAECGCWADTG
jgi:hypothetical protein